MARPGNKASAVPLVVVGVAAAAATRWLLRRNRAVHPAVVRVRTPGRGATRPGTPRPGRTATISGTPRGKTLPLADLDDVIVYGLRGVDGALVRWHNDRAEYHAADRSEAAGDRVPRTGAPHA